MNKSIIDKLTSLLFNKEIKEREFRNYISNFDDYCWYYASKYTDLSEDFIISNNKKVNWKAISMENKSLSKEFIIEYADKLDLFWIDINYNFTFKEIEKISEAIDVNNYDNKFIIDRMRNKVRNDKHNVIIITAATTIVIIILLYVLSLFKGD